MGQLLHGNCIHSLHFFTLYKIKLTQKSNRQLFLLNDQTSLNSISRVCIYIYDLITDADEACRSSEISINLIIIIVFLQSYSYFCYILTSFFMLLCCILDVYIYIYLIGFLKRFRGAVVVKNWLKFHVNTWHHRTCGTIGSDCVDECMLDAVCLY